MNPITREERLMASAAGGEPSGITPITREEMFLAYAAGESDTKPTPITRREMFLDKIEGGGASVPTQEKSITITENGTVEVLPDEGYALSKVGVTAQVYDAVDDRFAKFIEGPSADIYDPIATSVRVSVFENAVSVTSVDFPNVTAVGEKAFEDCTTLASVNLPKLTSLGARAFYNCKNLSGDLYFPELTTAETTDEGSQFYYCSSITSIRAPKLTSLTTSMFGRCTSLEKLSCPNIEYIPISNNTASPIYMCSALRIIDFRNFTGKNLSSSMMDNCSALECWDLGFYNRNSMYTTFLAKSNNLKVVSIRRTAGVTSMGSVSSLTGNYAVDGAGGYVIVPSALIPEYQTATNWSALYEAGTCTFLATEDYTIDGTLTGELDWDKVEALIGGTEV